MSKKTELQENIKKLEGALSSPSTPEGFKEKLKAKKEAFEKELAALDKEEKTPAAPKEPAKPKKKFTPTKEKVKSKPKKEKKPEVKKPEVKKPEVKKTAPTNPTGKIKTERDAAIDLIEAYVKRGDSIESLKAGGMGSSNGIYQASIGGHVNGKKIGSDKIIVQKLHGKTVNEIFSLQAIFDQIKKGLPAAKKEEVKKPTASAGKKKAEIEEVEDSITIQGVTITKSDCPDGYAAFLKAKRAKKRAQVKTEAKSPVEKSRSSFEHGIQHIFDSVKKTTVENEPGAVKKALTGFKNNMDRAINSLSPIISKTAESELRKSLKKIDEIIEAELA